MTAQLISPMLLSDPKHRKELEEDFDILGCQGLIRRPWSMKSDEMVRELVFGTPN